MRIINYSQSLWTHWVKLTEILVRFYAHFGGFWTPKPGGGRVFFELLYSSGREKRIKTYGPVGLT